MNDASQSLIKLESVTKVFFTDEVETHALSGIHPKFGDLCTRVDAIAGGTA